MSMYIQKMCSKQGFTLVELLMVIVVVSVISAGLVRILGQMTRGINFQHDEQIAIQLAQECSEYLLGLRRQLGYSMNNVDSCALLPLYGSNTVRPTVVKTDPSVDSVCPSSASCKRFDITATYVNTQAKNSILMISY